MKRALTLILLTLTVWAVIGLCSDSDMFEQIPLYDNEYSQENTKNVVGKHKPFIGVTVACVFGSTVAAIMTGIFGDQTSQMALIGPFAFIILMVVCYCVYHLRKSRRGVSVNTA